MALQCLDVLSWQAFTKQEVVDHWDVQQPLKKTGSALVFRSHLRGLDVYCYLKARFGRPNGLQSFLRQDDSDNFIHWDYNIKAGSENVYILGTDREVHVLLSERLRPADWPRFAAVLKADFGRLGQDKSRVLRSLEKWMIFPNKYAALAEVCADLHERLAATASNYQPFTPSRRTRAGIAADKKQLDSLSKRADDLYASSIQLSLLTPVMAEAFLNMIILITCRREIRDNARQFESFIRAEIDTKLFDLPFKCTGFERGIDRSSADYVNFKRVMDKRNFAIHGNVDPEREKIDLVYFDRKVPLFDEPGDQIGRFFDAVERQHSPNAVLADYENTHLFLEEIINCMEPRLRRPVRAILQDSYPGYDVGRKICGVLFPDFVKLGYFQGMQYDDELKVSWE